ncbi:hypothetical protein [Pseudomonas ficuserectae]|uniref:hypothetical protein n=1 Tax=Pseudomonas ficuserectae TaxID=53410 RepID=UPI0006D5DDDD|nr:hypothetical protein [Pseudomonas ficuserectae]KPX42751.1 Uncharacterized protein ALO69_00808 [Pseudomonas ficuserectae]RMS33605.1 hypothetical protein ALP68_00376 [Pseudomonas ficuserectae]RMS39472.1 hypothetical protein ALP67_03237 [Pseudomonas ficuserectae]
MKGILRGLVALACVTGALGAVGDERYKFEAYPASAVSAKAVSKIDWKSNPSYAKDLKSKEAVQWTVGKKPDFAGHFVVTSFSCGTGCQSTAFIDVNDGKIYKSPMQFPSEGTDLPKVSGGKAYLPTSNLIFMSSLGYAGTDMTQSDGVVVFDEKSKQFQILAKSKPYKMKF